MNLLEFMSENPILTIVLSFMISITTVDCFNAIAEAFRSRK